MEVRIRHGENKQATAFARFHRIVCDQPFENGGSDSGMTPPELMLAALGCCAMHYAVEYLKARHLLHEGIEIRVRAEQSERPARITEIRIEVNAPGLTMRARDGLLKAVNACLLHRTLTNPPKVEIAMAMATAECPHCPLDAVKHAGT